MSRKAELHPAAKVAFLKAAQGLMMARGFSATSVDEICKTANLSKGAFFHYFESKEDLGKEVLDYYVNGWTQAVLSAPFQEERDPLKRLYGAIDLFLRKSRHPGSSCLLGNLAQELSQSHSEMRSVCCAHFRHWSDGFQKELDAAKKKYKPGSSINTRSLAEYFLIVFEGALLFCKTNGDDSRKALRESLIHYKSYIKTLFET